VIFTESLVHGTLPWQGPGVRRTLFYKYAPHMLAWEKQPYFSQEGRLRPELEATLTETQRRLLDPPIAHDHRKPIP
jgi:hypothetical protein